MVGSLIRRPLPPVSDFIRTLLDDTTATAALATLGIVSGTYTPTLTAVVNIDATTAYTARYIRVGNVVAVMGKCDIDATLGAAAGTQFGISLPIASNLANSNNDCGGTMTIHGGSGVIIGDTTNDRALAYFLSGTTVNSIAAFSFMYTVI